MSRDELVDELRALGDVLMASNRMSFGGNRILYEYQFASICDRMDALLRAAAPSLPEPRPDGR